MNTTATKVNTPTTAVYLTEGAARADIARLEADDREAGVYEPEAYRIINAAPYFA